MTLDLLQLAPQVRSMAHEVGARRHALAARRDHALALMAQWDGRVQALRELARRDESRLVAEPLEPLLAAHPVPPLPRDVTVMATDGSSIDLDRHGLAQCYLVNVGAAVIRYGEHPIAELSSQAALYYRDEDLYLDGDGARVAVQGALVDLKRTLAEQQRALELVRARRDDAPTVVVMDGTLLLWRVSGRASEDGYVSEAIAAYAAGLDEFRRLGVPVCSYISRPNSGEVVDLLRVAACPDGRPPCARCIGGRCADDLLEPLPDRALMAHLAPGERSARFASRSPVLRQYGPDGGVEFVYLNAGEEIVRLEVPAWVGRDAALLDLVHAAIHDGCRRGWGYPPALAEAHERAVIRGGEREAFLRLVMSELNDADQVAAWSVKRLSKNRRAV